MPRRLTWRFAWAWCIGVVLTGAAAAQPPTNPGIRWDDFDPATLPLQDTDRILVAQGAVDSMPNPFLANLGAMIDLVITQIIGGLDTMVQYNCAGLLCGDAGLVYDDAADDLEVGNQVRAGGQLQSDIRLRIGAGLGPSDCLSIDFDTGNPPIFYDANCDGVQDPGDDDLSIDDAGGAVTDIWVDETGDVYSNTIQGSSTGAWISAAGATANVATMGPASGDLDTGIGWAPALCGGGDSGLSFIAQAGQVAEVCVTGIHTATATGPMLENAAASITNPTIIPNQADPTSGLSHDGVHPLIVDNAERTAYFNHESGVTLEGGTTGGQFQLSVQNDAGDDPLSAARIMLFTQPSAPADLRFFDGSYRAHLRATTADSLEIATGPSLTTGLTIDSAQDATFTGSILLPNTTFSSQEGVIFKGGTRFLHDFNYGFNGTVTTTGGNLFLGAGAGNFTMGSTATIANHGSLNTMVGYESGGFLTTGSVNTGVGRGSFYALTTGASNAAVGAEALTDLTIGDYNTAFGAFSLHKLVDASQNVAVGSLALSQLTTGNGTTAIGYEAGAYLADGGSPNASGVASTYIGHSARASASGLINENVIGWLAEGHGSNTVTLGNDSVTDTYLKGDQRITESVYLPNTTFADQEGVLFKGGTRFLHDFNYGNNGTVTTDGGNLFLGKNAGNFTMGSTATGANEASGNTMVGNGSGSALTLGYQNTGIGTEVFQSLTVGGENVAIGRAAQYSMTTGSNNTSLGVLSLWQNVSAVSNSAVGYAALGGLTSGGGMNVALGFNAGAYLLDGSTPNTASQGSVYLGSSTKVTSASAGNEIVIGYQAEGHGSNTATLGNDSITDTYLKGTTTITEAGVDGYTFTEGVALFGETDSGGGILHLNDVWSLRFLENDSNGTNYVQFTGPDNVTAGNHTCQLVGGAAMIPDSCVGDGVDDGAGGGDSIKEYIFPASALLPLEHAADSIAPIVKLNGTNVDILVRAFDAATDECAQADFALPSDLDSAGTVTFRTSWFAATAPGTADKDVYWDVREIEGGHGEQWDAATSTETGAGIADTVQGERTVTTWTETVTNLGWTASDHVAIELCRDANNGSDDLAVDAYLIFFAVEVPRA